MDNGVYGISDIPFNGNSILSQELVYIYAFTTILFLLSVTYLFFFKNKWRTGRFSRFLIMLFIVNALFLAASVSTATYIFTQEPSVAAVTPARGTEDIPIRNPRISIFFDIPVDRARLEKHLTPNSPGAWAYEDKIPGTNMYKKLVFYPATTLKADTEYTVTLTNIYGYFKNSPLAYTYSFKTQDSPKVLSVTPQDKSQNVNPETKIEVILDAANDKISEFDFELSPSHPIDITYDDTSLKYTLSPRKPFEQGTTYALKVRKTNLAYSLPEETISERGDTTTEYEGIFTVIESPGIESFNPRGDQVFLTTPIIVSFSDEMDRQSVENNFELTPKLFGEFSWNHKTMTFRPFDMRHNTAYTVRIPKGTRSAGGGFLPEDIVRSFTTIGNARVEKIYPEDRWDAVSVASTVQITFDQDVDTVSAENRFSLEPPVPGTFAWDKTTMTFTPDINLEFSTAYQIRIAGGVASINGLPSKEEYVSIFTTQEKTVKLDVPSYIQKYSLSCEIAALRMALEFKGTKVSEDTLIAAIGFDMTPNSGGVWGDPHNAFVGNINGRQMVDGYGVHWEPIAAAARKYRNATEFTQGNIGEILQEVEKGNPVIVWTYTRNGAPLTWNTPAGRLINAVYGEHSVVVVGFIGQTADPSYVIVNDPLVGQVHWTREYFEQRWNALGRSGVIVY